MKEKKVRRNNKFFNDLKKGLEEYVAYCEGKLKLTEYEVEVPTTKRSRRDSGGRAYAKKR